MNKNQSILNAFATFWRDNFVSVPQADLESHEVEEPQRSCHSNQKPEKLFDDQGC